MDEAPAAIQPTAPMAASAPISPAAPGPRDPEPEGFHTADRLVPEPDEGASRQSGGPDADAASNAPDDATAGDADDEDPVDPDQPARAPAASNRSAGKGIPPTARPAPSRLRSRLTKTDLHLSTDCRGLDDLFGGGLERDAITLVFGEGGSGKTNLALQCARQAAREGKRIAYVDTEGVSAIRLSQVFAGLDAGLQERILFFTPYSIEEQERLVQNATRVPDLGLVVVDSINMHYRLHIDGGEESERDAARSLYRQLHHLTGFSRQQRVPVLVTGQVYGGEDATQPFARRVMEHLVKALVRFEKKGEYGAFVPASPSAQTGGLRKATVIKHRSVAEGAHSEFRIGAHGLDDA